MIIKTAVEKTHCCALDEKEREIMCQNMKNSGITDCEECPYILDPAVIERLRGPLPFN